MSYYSKGAAEPFFSEACFRLAEALGAKVTEEQIRLHARLLSDVPWEELRVAFAAAANTLDRGFYPTPGQLRSFLAPNPDDAALLAWAALTRAAEAAGSWSDVVLEDKAAADAVMLVFGSWPAFCQMDEGPAMHARRQEFLAAYRNASRGRKGAQPAVRLRGLCEPGEAAGATWTALLTAGGEVRRVRESDLQLPPRQQPALGAAVDTPPHAVAQQGDSQAQGEPEVPVTHEEERT